MPLGSLLKTGIKELSDDFVTQSKSVPNLLKKKGVKPEEQEFAKLDLPEGKVTKADLVKAEEGRADKFGKVSIEPDDASYTSYSLPAGKQNPTYRENVLTYSDKGAKPEIQTGDKDEYFRLLARDEDQANEYLEGLSQKYGKEGEELLEALEAGGNSRYTSSHFPDVPNYLMHTRSYDDTFDGTPTRVVQEIQSDLHQAGRQQGYGTQEASPRLQAFEDLRSASMDDAVPDDELLRQARALGFTLEDLPVNLRDRPVDGIEDWATDGILGHGGGPDTGVTIPKSPYEKTWLRKGMEQEITDAIAQGRDQIAIPIKGDLESLSRGEGVQKWYENFVEPTARKLAKSSGMDYELKTVGSDIDPVLHSRLIQAFKEGDYNEANEIAGLIGIPESVKLPNWIKKNPVAGKADEVTYAVLKGKPKKPFNLYASPATATMTAYLAFKGGMPQEDIENQLSEEGHSPAEIQSILGDVQKVQKMKEAGYSDEDIKPLLEQQEVQVQGTASKPTSPLQERTPNRFTDAYLALTGNEELTPKELVAKMNVVQPDLSYAHTNVAGFFGDQEAARVSEEAVQAQRGRIIALAGKQGLELEWDEQEHEWVTFAGPVEGGKVIVTPEWYKSFWEAKGEVVGGVSGAIIGAKTGAAMSPPPVTPWTAVAKAAMVLGGSVIGAAVGAAGGSQLDYLHSAMVLQQDAEAAVMANKAFNAAEMSVIADVATMGVLKLGKGSWKSLVKVKEFVKNGTLDRANTALKETFFLTDDEAAEFVTKLANVTDVPGRTAKDQAIAATAVTKPGLEELVSASVSHDPKASRAVVKAIDDRAKDLLESTKELSGDDVGRFIREDLEGYKTLVKENFSRVKAKAAQAPKLNAFSFNYDKMAIDPLLTKIQEGIDPNSPLAFKFARQVQTIRDMSASRRLPDLIELRHLMNNFKYNKALKSKSTLETLDNMIVGIDRSIRQGAEVTMENPKKWVAEWSDANTQYAKMKDLETNKLAKAISERPAKDLSGKSEADLAKALSKYAMSLDSTFVDVIAKLPRQSKIKVEGLVIDNLANKYTSGAVEGIKATNFPGLAEDLRHIQFSTPEARSMKMAIMELADVFKNDLPLSEVAGGIQLPQFAQALTTSPTAKAQYALASESFKWVRQLMPTAKGRASSLIRKTAKLLEEPMNSKRIKELQVAFDGQVNIADDLEQVVKNAAMTKAAGTGMHRVKLYGDGKVLTAKGAGKEQSVAVHRIATTDIINEVVEATGISRANKRALDIALIERGYKAAQLGSDKVRLLEK